MLLDLLARYLEDVETGVSKIEGAYVELYEEEVLSSDRVNLRLRIRFSSGHLLELNESVIVEVGQIRHLGYRYHLQDGQNDLVFRYDNTPHFPDLGSFPQHKHLSGKVVSAGKPQIPEVIKEAKLYAR